MSLVNWLRRRRSLVSMARRLSIPDYVEPVRRRFYSPHVIEKDLGKHRVKMVIDNPMSEEWYERTGMAKNTRFFMESLVNEGDVVADVGAHNGLYTLLSAFCVGDEGCVYAFEPLPSNFRTLTANVELNQVVNARLFNLAVGARSASARFNEFNDGMTSDHGRIEVEVEPLARVMDSPVDVLKIDVEGAECEVLEGARDVITDSTRIMCEVHPDRLGYFNRSTSDVVELLRSFGGRLLHWDELAGQPVNFADSVMRKRCFLYRVPDG